MSEQLASSNVKSTDCENKVLYDVREGGTEENGGCIPAQILFSLNMIYSLQRGQFLSSLGSCKLRELILMSWSVYQCEGAGETTKQSIISDMIVFMSKCFRCIIEGSSIWRGWEDGRDTVKMTSILTKIYNSTSYDEIYSYFTIASPSDDASNAMSLGDWNLEGLRSLQDVLFICEEDFFIITERSIQLRECILNSRVVYQLRGTGESTRQSMISDMVVFISKSFMSLEGYNWSVWDKTKDAERMTKVLQRIYTSISDDEICKYFVDASELKTYLLVRKKEIMDGEEDSVDKNNVTSIMSTQQKLDFNLLLSLPHNKAMLAEPDQYGRLPIHMAVKSNTSAKAVEQLIDACTEALHHPDLNGYLPIHWAARSNFSTSPEVVDLLIKYYPEGVCQPDKKGFLPIHLAALFNISPAIVDRIIHAFPEGIRQPNEYGELPIHCAARNNISPKVVYHLIKTYPEGLCSRDECGSLPIHKAAESNTSIAVINVLLDWYPEGLLEQDNNGEPPKGVAISKNRSADIISCLDQSEAS